MYSGDIFHLIWFPLKQWNGEFNKDSGKVITYLKRRLLATVAQGDCVVVETFECTIKPAQLAALKDNMPEDKIRWPFDYNKNL